MPQNKNGVGASPCVRPCLDERCSWVVYGRTQGDAPTPFWCKMKGQSYSGSCEVVAC